MDSGLSKIECPINNQHTGCKKQEQSLTARGEEKAFMTTLGEAMQTAMEQHKPPFASVVCQMQE